MRISAKKINIQQNQAKIIDSFAIKTFVFKYWEMEQLCIR